MKLKYSLRSRLLSSLYQRQIGTNNCAARYRTLSGGIGAESPTPTHSSDYVDDEEGDNDDMTENTAVLNGITNSSADCGSGAASANMTKHLKPKQNSHSSHLSKASTISYQKASVHYVRTFSRFIRVKAFQVQHSA